MQNPEYTLGVQVIHAADVTVLLLRRGMLQSLPVLHGYQKTQLELLPASNLGRGIRKPKCTSSVVYKVTGQKQNQSFVNGVGGKGVEGRGGKWG